MDPSLRVVVCLIGIPGCGKTRAARAVAASCPSASIVSFDDFPTSHSTSDLAVDRDEALTRVRSCVACKSNSLVVVDDVMYYRSMRREVYCIARDAGWAYLQVYFPIDLSVAHERNEQREGLQRLPRHVVDRIALRMEPPQQRGWDVALVYPQHDNRDDFGSWLCQHLVDARHATVEKPTHDVGESSSSDRHNLDLALRHEIGVIVASSRNPAVAARLNAERKRILQDCAHYSIEKAVEQLRLSK
jgi:tRNA uridine 5-carbamoylmethylation protein Kti12